MKVVLLVYYAAVLGLCAFIATRTTSPSPPPTERPAGHEEQRPGSSAPAPVAKADPAAATTLAAGGLGSSRTARVIAAPVATQGATLEPVKAATVAASADGGAPPVEKPFAPGEQILVLVVLAGALGGVLHGLTSLAAHSGAGRLDRRWWVFYVARPVVGGGLALVVALVLRAGLLGVSVTEDVSGRRVLLAWGALAGLFSSPALKKLKDVFDGLGPNDDEPPKPGGRGTGTAARGGGASSGGTDSAGKPGEQKSGDPAKPAKEKE
jgi:hypothetical protein